MECDLEIETLIGGILTQTLRMILLKQVMNVQFQKDLSSQLKRLSLIIWLAHLTCSFDLLIWEITNATDTYAKSDVDAKLYLKADQSNTYTKPDVDTN